MAVKERTYTIEKFLGVNENPDGDTRLKMGEASAMKNYRITDDYSLRKRPGSKNIAGLMSSYTTAVGSEAETLTTNLNSATSTFTLYPTVSVSDTGLLSLSGTSVTMNYANHGDYTGYYYQDPVTDLIWKFDDCVYTQPSGGTHVAGGAISIGSTLHSGGMATPTFYPNISVVNGAIALSGTPVQTISSAYYGYYFYYNGYYHQFAAIGEAYYDGYSFSYARGYRITVVGDDEYAWNFFPVTAASNTTDNVVRGIWSGYVDGDEYIVAACNGHLWSLSVDDETGLWSKTDIGSLTTTSHVHFFGFDEKLYILNGSQYKVWDGTTFSDVSGYRPLVYISSPPTGGGTALEQVNKLTAAKRQRFSPASSATLFQLSETGIASVDYVKLNGVTVSTDDYTVDLTNGTVTFDTAPSDGTNTVEIGWTGSTSDRAAVLAMTYAELYNGSTDNRIFLYGDGSNLALYSGIEYETGNATAEYFPDLNVMHVGDANTPITSLLRHYSRLLAFKEDSAFSIGYGTITLEDGSVTAGFYITPINRYLGNCAIGQATLVENYARSLDGRSIYEWKATSTSGNVTDSQRNAKRISQRVEQTLGGFDLASAITYFDKINHEYYVMYDGKMVVQNTETDAWYIYDNLPATCMIVYKDEVYFGTDDAYIRHLSNDYMSDNGEEIECYYESGAWDFDAPNQRKYCSELWIGLKPEANSAVNVTVTTDRRTDYSEESAASDYAEIAATGFFSFLNLDFRTLSFNVNRMPKLQRLKIKVKKFGYYKLIFSSVTNNTTTTINSVTLRVMYMGYVR